MTYDAEWNKTRDTVGVGSADEASTFYQYDIVGRLELMIDPLGRQWRTEYDVMNRKKSETDPLGNKTEWTYDVMGRTATEKRPDGGVSTNKYDDINRLTQTIDNNSRSS